MSARSTASTTRSRRRRRSSRRAAPPSTMPSTPGRRCSTTSATGPRTISRTSRSSSRATSPTCGNGMKRPAVRGVQLRRRCLRQPDVGVSMAEQFLQLRQRRRDRRDLRQPGQLDLRYNDADRQCVLPNLFPGRHVVPDRPSGRAARSGKAADGVPADYSANSQRYNLMGDPALRLPHPVDDLDACRSHL